MIALKMINKRETQKEESKKVINEVEVIIYKSLLEDLTSKEKFKNESIMRS